ncbi:hypothetical protein C8R43DRAFT_1111231 [Mycena crocata]|nr:hypothetical protein C8R43DRAFT_1111231 [Mycena crocata]
MSIHAILDSIPHDFALAQQQREEEERDALVNAREHLADLDAAVATQLARIERAWKRISSKGLTSFPGKPSTRSECEAAADREYNVKMSKGRRGAKRNRKPVNAKGGKAHNGRQ